MTAQAPQDIIEHLTDIFERRGAEAYLGEDVTVAEHMLQCAALAQAEGAAPTLVIAALLHDVGHFAGEFEFSLQDTVDHKHDVLGAAVLEGYFPPEITEAVRLHVAAKRYLCATRDDYYDKLSAASKHSLALQGGPMSEADVDRFRTQPHHAEAVSVRLWDDAAKTIGLATPSFADFRPLLKSVLVSRI